MKHRATVLAVCAIIALALRLALLPQPGNVFDVTVFKAWGLVALERGFGAIYSGTPELERIPLSFPNYALFLPYLRLAAWVHVHYLAPHFGPNPWQFAALIKLAAVAGDVALAFVAERFVRSRRSPRAALLVFLALLFSPQIFYVSAVWGQTDSLHTLFLLAGVAALSADRMTRAWGSLIAAILFKAQSVLLLPLLGIVHLRRGGILAPVGHGAAAAAAAFAVTAPFWISDPAGVFRSFKNNVSLYPYVSANAMNVWWPAMVTPAGTPRLDTEILFGAVTYRAAGFILLAAALAFLAVFAFRAKLEAGNLAILAALFSLAFFLFPTEIHERYLYPAVAFMIVAAAFDLRLALPAFFLSTSFLVNILLVTPFLAMNATPTTAASSPADLLAVHLWWVINLGVFVAASFVMILRIRAERRAATA